MKSKYRIIVLAIAIAGLLIITSKNYLFNTKQETALVMTKSGKAIVTWKNYPRAQSDTMLKSFIDKGSIGKWFYFRKPTPIDNQPVIRQNRDTLYSVVVLDLNEPVTITLPDTGDRYISLAIISEDHYVPYFVYKPGKYTFTEKGVGTRYILAAVRILVDSNNPADIKKVQGIQDQVKISQKSVGKFEIPNWDRTSLNRITKALNDIGKTMTDTSKCFGKKEDVDPTAHLICSATAWGGNPLKDAAYINVVPEKNDGVTPYTLILKDVPVNGFWSVNVYNRNGYFQRNKYNAYNINSVTAKKEKDGSIIIHFGGSPKQANYIGIMNGWNYLFRLYQPTKEYINGEWKLPESEIAK